MKTVLAIIAVLGLATIAQASVVVEVDPGVDVGNGLTSYTVRLVADTEADIVTAWKGSFDGPMNQVWAFSGGLPTPTRTNCDAFMTPEETAQDSHFLFPDDQLLPVVAPNESSVHLSGTFGITPAATDLNLVFAQIVLAAGEEVVMTGAATNGVVEFDTTTTIPEPMTMTLLGLGGIGVLIRRRKK